MQVAGAIFAFGAGTSVQLKACELEANIAKVPVCLTELGCCLDRGLEWVFCGHEQSMIAGSAVWWCGNFAKWSKDGGPWHKVHGKRGLQGCA